MNTCIPAHAAWRNSGQLCVNPRKAIGPCCTRFNSTEFRPLWNPVDDGQNPLLNEFADVRSTSSLLKR